MVLADKTVAVEDRAEAKGNLEDILHAIDIDENPIVQAEFIEEDGQKLKKAKSAKKLEFGGEDAGFMFQERNPMTRHARKLLESSKEVQPPTDTTQPPQDIIDLSSPPEKDTVSKSKKGKEKAMEKTELQLIEEKLKLDNLEIAVMKRKARIHSREDLI